MELPLEIRAHIPSLVFPLSKEQLRYLAIKGAYEYEDIETFSSYVHEILAA